MKLIAIGLTLTCLTVLTGCSGQVRYIKTTEYLPCQNVKALAIKEPHPSRANLQKNRDLEILIDQYALRLTLQNNRMDEIVGEVDDCMAKAAESMPEDSPSVSTPENF